MNESAVPTSADGAASAARGDHDDVDLLGGVESRGASGFAAQPAVQVAHPHLADDDYRAFVDDLDWGI